MLTSTASNRFSTSKGMLWTLTETMIAKSDDKFVTHNMKWGNTDQISTRLCRHVRAELTSVTHVVLPSNRNSSTSLNKKSWIRQGCHQDFKLPGKYNK